MARSSRDRLYPRAHEPRSFRRSSLGARQLSPRETEVLRIVTERPGISVVELRELLGISNPRVSQLIARLEPDHIRRDEPPTRRDASES